MTKQVKRFQGIGAVVLSLLLLVVSFPLCTISAAAGTAGTVYYVAADGSDDNSGLSKDKPLSLAGVNEIELYGGDAVMFKRGDTFYGQLDLQVNDTTDGSRVEIGAYGTGDLPVISNAKIVASAWTQEGGFFTFDLTADGDYSGVNNDNTDVGFLESSTGAKYYSLKATADDCTAEYDYYCDETGIHMMTDTDPYAELGTLTLAMDGTVFKMSPGMNIHDLHLQYGGGHGMGWSSQVTRSTCGYVHIYDCVIEDIGGSELSRTVNEDSSVTITRYGNGIELYNAGSNMLIENNIIRNCYDVAFTAQGRGTDSYAVWSNVIVRNNVLAYNTQALEIWCNDTDTGAGVQGLTFENNLCIGQGEGWGYEARPEKWQAADVLAYGYSNDTWNMTLQNNTFFHAKSGVAVHTIYAVSLTTYISEVTVENSYIYQPTAADIVLFVKPVGTLENASTYTFAKWQTYSGNDAGGTWTAVGEDGAAYDAMKALAQTSVDFDTIVQAAKDAGVTVKAESRNLIAAAVGVQLYEVRHQLDWSILEDDDPDNDVPDYSNTQEFRLSTGKYGSDGDFYRSYSGASDAMQAAAVTALYDGDKETSAAKKSGYAYHIGMGIQHAYTDPTFTDAEGNKVAWVTYPKTDAENYAAFCSDKDLKASQYRYGLMYDLGDYYDLSQITLSFGAKDHRYAYGYSVYAGFVNDKSILSNCVGHGGISAAAGAAAKVQIDTTAELDGMGRYVLIMFDFMYNDPGVSTDSKWSDDTTKSTQYTGYGNHNADAGIAVTEIVLKGEEVEPETDLIANAVDVNLYRVKHDLNWNEGEPDYTDTTEFTLGGYNGDTSGKFRTGITDKVQAAWEAALCDGDTSTTPYKTAAGVDWYRGIGGIATSSSTTNTKTAYTWLSEYRYGLLYDLGQSYDLSAITLSFGTDKRPVYGFSVYAGSTVDVSILSNCVGRGGVAAGTTLTPQMNTSAELSGTGRYVLIMFDYMHTDPGNKNDTLWGDEATQSTTVSGYSNPNCDGSIAVTEIVLKGFPRVRVAEDSKGKVTIDDISNDGTVTVTADIPDGSVLAPNGLTYSYEDNTYPVVNRKDACDANGNHNKDQEDQRTTYTFRLPSTSSMVTVSAEFVKEGTANLTVLGAGINPSKLRMRFHSRVYKTYTGENGVSYTAKEMGTILLKDSAKEADIEDVFTALKDPDNSDYAADARLVPTTVLYDRCVDYYEYVCQLQFTPNGGHLDDNYTAYAYTTYVDGSGNTVTLYSDSVVRNYNGIVEKLGLDYDTDYFQYRSGLLNTYAKLTQEKELTVAYMGGSVTYGFSSTAVSTDSYRALTTSWLKNQFPDATITEVNAGVPSACSAFGAYWVDKVVLPEKPDLVFLEYAINDYYARTMYTAEDVSRHYETIIRKLRTACPDCDIVALYTTDNTVSKQGTAYFDQAKIQDEIAEMYGIPAICVGYQACQELNLTNGTASAEWYTYFKDGVHPTDAGHAKYAAIITGYLEDALVDAPAKLEGVRVTDKTMPAAKNSDLVMDGAYIQALNLNISSMTGWSKNETGKGIGASFVYHTGYLYASKTNNSLTFTFTGTEIAIFCTASRSITYSVDGGTETTIKLNNHPIRLATGLSEGEHTVTITCNDVADNSSTTFQIAGALIA